MPNGNGGDGGPAGGTGKGAGTSDAGVLAGLATTLSEIVEIAKALETIDGLTARSVVCEIDNVCGHALNFESSNFDHGGFGSNVPEFSIADQKPSLFGAGSSGILVGVEGHVTYGIDDGRGSKLIVHFDNPEVGGNSSDCHVEGPIANAYFTNSITGNGDNGAHMRYIVGHFNPPFSLKVFLRNTKPSGFNPGAATTSIRSLPGAAAIIKSGPLSVKGFMSV
jgi:hypothetical protein